MFTQSGIDRLRVILIEDDSDLREGLTDFLRLNNLTVTPVADGAEFASAMVNDVFDVAVVDINLPDTDGFEITRILARKPNIGVIIVTARTSRDDKIRGYNEGANLFLTKPVDGDELVLAVKNLSSRIKRASRDGGKAPQSEWIFDRAGHRLVSPRGVVIKLSGRETQLILSLTEGKGSVVSRSDLELLLGYKNLGPDNRSLDAVIRRLRAKAREAGVELPIHALHASGFQFSADIRHT